MLHTNLQKLISNHNKIKHNPKLKYNSHSSTMNLLVQNKSDHSAVYFCFTILAASDNVLLGKTMRWWQLWRLKTVLVA